MIIQNTIIKIFDKSEMQRLKTAFNTKMKRRNKNYKTKTKTKNIKTIQAKRLLSNKQSFHRSSVKQLNNQPSVTAKKRKMHTENRGSGWGYLENTKH